jgi:diketogulonate reductase-like aldo/keto reductase
MGQPGTIVPLIGARNLKQLEDNLGVLDVSLTEDQISRLNEVSEMDLGFPHNFLSNERIRDVVSGGTYDQLDR